MSKLSWFEGWLERKEKYARAQDKFLSEEKFSAIGVGTGLPAISQKSTFSFKIGRASCRERV